MLFEPVGQIGHGRECVLMALAQNFLPPLQHFLFELERPDVIADMAVAKSR